MKFFTLKMLKAHALLAACGLSLLFTVSAGASELVQCAVPRDLSNPEDNSGKCGSHTPVNAQTLTAEGQHVEFTAVPADGYRFEYWENVNGGSRTYDNPISVSYDASISMLQLRACFAPTYVVTLEPCSGVFPDGAANRITAIYGHPYGHLDDPQRDGYDFAGWFTAASGGEQVTENTTVTAVAAHSLYAHWNLIVTTITFDSCGGDPAKTARTVAYGSKYGDLPSVTRKGYEFKGWCRERDNLSTKISAEDTMRDVDDFTVYAKWEPVKYTIRFLGNGNTSGEMADQTMVYDKEKELSPNVYKRTNYSFGGWNTNADGSGTSYADCEIVSNLCTDEGPLYLYAQWYYTVAFDGGGATSGEMSPQKIPCDVKTALASNDFVRTGYTFDRWTNALNSAEYQDGAEVINLQAENGIVPLVATWSPNEYVVTFKRAVISAGGEMDELEFKCVYDTPTNLPACTISNPLGTFLGWARDPKATVPDFADGALVSNLTAVAGATVPLYAVWDSDLTELSRAANCDTLVLSSSGEDPWTITNYTDGANTCTCLQSGYYYNGVNSDLVASVNGPGVLYFDWCVSGSTNENNWALTYKGVSVGVAVDPDVIMYSYDMDVPVGAEGRIGFGSWHSTTGIVVGVGASQSVVWRSKARSDSDPEYDQGRLFVRNITWTPDVDTNLIYTVKFDPGFDSGEGSGEMEAEIFPRGIAVDLPTNAFARTGYVFVSWLDKENSTNYLDGATVVDLVAKGGTNTLVAVWRDIRLQASAQGYSGPYDGAGHGISVSVSVPDSGDASGVVVGYSLSADGPFLADNPLYTNVTSATVWYEASLAGYISATGSATVVITQANNAWTVAPSLAGWTEGETPSVPSAEAAFGEYTVTYSSGGSNPPTAAGSYTATFVVEETENWTGLSNDVDFTIAALPPPPPPPAMDLLWSNDSAFDGSVARTYDGWALSSDGTLAAVIQLKTKKLQSKGGVESFAATATAKDSSGKTMKYSKGVGSSTGAVSGFVCTTKNPSVATFDAMLGADNLSGDWGGYEIFGARAGMGVKGDKMAVALEAYRGIWTVMLTNATGTTSLQLNVGARGSTKISGTAAGGFKVNAKAQSVMGEDGLYIPYLAVLKKGSVSYGASLLVRLAADGSVDVISSSLGALADGHIGTNPIVFSPVVETGTGSGVPLEQGAVLKFSVGIPQRISLGVVGQDGVVTKLKAKGLPSGLKLVKTKVVDASGATVLAYAIAGVPKKAQAAKEVVLTATNKSKWKGVFSFNIEVAALPAAAVGAYSGLVVAADDAKSTGEFTLKLAATGKIAGKFNLGGKKVSFNAKSLDRTEESSGGFVAKISYKLNGVKYADDEILIVLDQNEGVYCAALLSAPSGVLADAVAYRER